MTGQTNEMSMSNRLKRITALMVIMIIVSSVGLSAKERSHGSTITVEKKDGTLIKGELLKVQPSSILIMEQTTLQGKTVSIGEINEIKILKPKAFKTGLLSGLITGAAAGFICWRIDNNHSEAVFGGGGGLAILTGLLGGVGTAGGAIFGGLFSIPKTILIQNRSEQDLNAILKKLNNKARFPQDWPGSTGSTLSDSSAPGDSTPESPLTSNQPTSETREKARVDEFHQTEFTRLHLTVDSGIVFHNPNEGYEKMTEAIYWPTYAALNPNHNRYANYSQGNQAVHWLKNVKAEYSLGKTFAVGLAYSPLYLENVTESVDIFSNEAGRYSAIDIHGKGNAFFLTGSYTILANDPLIRDSSLKVGAGVGISKIQLDFKSGNGYVEDPGMYPTKTLSAKTVCFMANAEYSYYITKNISLGVNMEYKYIPMSVDSFQFEACGYEFDYSDSNYGSDSLMVPVEVPRTRFNFGGFGAGLGFGLHF